MLTAVGTPIAAVLALIGVVVTSWLSYRSERRKAGRDELARIERSSAEEIARVVERAKVAEERADRYWHQVEKLRERDEMRAFELIDLRAKLAELALEIRALRAGRPSGEQT